MKRQVTVDPGEVQELAEALRAAAGLSCLTAGAQVAIGRLADRIEMMNAQHSRLSLDLGMVCEVLGVVARVVCLVRELTDAVA